jgi:hypothetical protein
MNDEPEGEVPPGLQKNLKRKRNLAPEEENEDSPHRTWEKHIDYHHLHDPFSDNEDDEEIVNATAIVCDETFSVMVNNSEPTLKDARKSPKWPEWEKAIKAKLAQLKKMGTWRLVKKPKHAIPITNKWVFVLWSPFLFSTVLPLGWLSGPLSLICYALVPLLGLWLTLTHLHHSHVSLTHFTFISMW